MSDQGKIKVFLIQLMFPDSQAKKKKNRREKVKNYFSSDEIFYRRFFYRRNFMPTFSFQ